MNYTTLRLILFGIASNLLVASWCSAAGFYVRKGATGLDNGSDWSNAWSDTNRINYALVKPGDTVYIGAGTYGSLNMGASGTSSNPITFIRATIANHGTATGWSNNYDGRVIIDGNGNLSAVSMRSFTTIDGASRYGIWLRNAYAGITGGGDNMTVRYVEIGDGGIYKMGEDGIQGRGSNLLVENSYIHDNDNPNTHGDGIQWYSGYNIVIRYNVFQNNGQIMMLTETAWGNEYINDLYVYYNVFRNRGGDHYNGISKKLCPQAGYGWYIYNNTWDLEATVATGWKDDIFGGAGSCTQMRVQNNAIIYTRAGSLTSVTHSYNGFDNSNPYAAISIPSESGSVVAADLGFVNVEGSDYHLTASSPLIGKGVNLGLVRDFDGKPLPALPSIGAFEVGASPTFLPPPTGLRVVQ